MLTRLIYASEPSEPLNPAAVQAIVDHASAANARRGVTGVLLFDSSYFLQVLEGTRETVSALFCRIAADKRHRRLMLLESSPVVEREFMRWSMGFAAADNRGREAFLRFGGSTAFDPYALGAPGALGLLRALSPV